MTPNAPSVLCPIDFSDFSRQALAHAVVIANHFGARLIVLSVDDQLLTDAAVAAGLTPSPQDETRHDLQRFCADILTSSPGACTVEYCVTVGKAATEILRAARERHVDLIVMSSHGRSGMRKMFFGSTTERVLRETSVPVLVTRDWRRPFTSLSELARYTKRIIVPVDFTNESAHQLSVAHRIASALDARLLAVHVLEPLYIPQRVRASLPGAEQTRRSQAEEKLVELTGVLEGPSLPESMVLLGEPAEEIVKLADARTAGLIVMGLHSSGILGPRMGSVTYRVLCQTEALVLAVPPHVAKPVVARSATRATTGAALR